MKLRKTSNLFYIIFVFFASFSLILAGLATTKHTYAESEEVELISDEHFVTIYDSGESLTVKTNAKTVEEALKRAKIEVEKFDKTDPSLETEINSDNFKINIYRAKPVTVTDGVVKKYLMSAASDGKTIAEEAGFTIYDGDEINFVEQETADFLETGLSSTYKIKREGGREITVEEDIPYKEVTENDYTLTTGQTELKQIGEIGRKVSKYVVNFVDGKEVSRELISEEVVKEPVDRVTVVGMKATIRPEWETCAGYAREAGVSEDELYVALTIIYKESGCRYNATNASSGAYGIPQALPGRKMASAGADWQTNPVTQIRWMISYVNGRYGGWNQAWAFWQEHHWY